MSSFGNLVRNLRLTNNLPLRQVAAVLDIDQAILSKMEHGKRKPTREQVLKIAEFFKVNPDELLVAWLADKVRYALGDDEELSLKALKVAEEQVEYIAFSKTDRDDLLKKLIDVIKKFDNIKKAWIYGSFSRKDDGPHSDIDVAIETEEKFSYFDLGEVKHQAEQALHRKVDVGFMKLFKPYIFENIKSDLKLIYEKK